MNLTLKELQEKMVEQLDEIDVLELLKVTTRDLVYAFADKVADNEAEIEELLTLGETELE